MYNSEIYKLYPKIKSHDKFMQQIIRFTVSIDKFAWNKHTYIVYFPMKAISSDLSRLQLFAMLINMKNGASLISFISLQGV